ncbi:ABC transporter ATP-binding protein [Sandaracinus amylolyticus]|uniref:ABC transporter ATP-binding protein n=1 Tax=Sandaracinus amylolyticus TaxID=927083 RepID=UPI001F2000BF|nr:ATP-binding cassette domain-containing protein [Sandaracinus amylolyticus]UJR78285.1 ABC-type molybdenum transport system, ATPase component/photorepair protein PhrA [Sandaracinus amylolyticus]
MAAVLEMNVARWEREGRVVLDGVRLTIERGEHWVILGPNGAGKSSLLSILTAYEWPTEGVVRVLGETYGRCDMTAMKRRMGIVSATLGAWLRPEDVAEEVAASGLYALIGPWRTYDDEDRRRGREALARLRAQALAGRPYGRLSQGERQRVLIARALVGAPDLLVLDEPCVSLDPSARERFLDDVERLVDEGGPTTLVVTHHVEEIPRFVTHALVLREGRVVASGPIDRALTSATLSEAFGAPCTLHRDAGRFRLAIGR